MRFVDGRKLIDVVRNDFSMTIKIERVVEECQQQQRECVTASIMFCWRAIDFSTEIERRFFGVESIDGDASIDRDARKRSIIT